MKKKILFVLKLRAIPNKDDKENLTPAGYGFSSGLLNSANFVNNMLNKSGFESRVVEVQDNNCIDKEVAKFKPDIVIIEAYWVVPEKFQILSKLHPKVKWIIRNHSEIPFLANEGMAMDWTIRYLQYPNVAVSCNSNTANEEFRLILKSAYPKLCKEELVKRTPYLPNSYIVHDKPREKKHDKCHEFINIGCFGAVRPLKNHLEQAIAAIKFADSINKKLRFHINVGRSEMKGDPILHNLRGLFKHLPEHDLIEHYWCDHKAFIELVRSMDIGLQVSFSETFNIVAADFVDNNVPVVVSGEISWVQKIFHASPTDSDDIAKKLDTAYFIDRYIPFLNKNKKKLKKYIEKSEQIWVEYLSSI